MIGHYWPMVQNGLFLLSALFVSALLCGCGRHVPPPETPKLTVKLLNTADGKLYHATVKLRIDNPGDYPIWLVTSDFANTHLPDNNRFECDRANDRLFEAYAFNDGDGRAVLTTVYAQNSFRAICVPAHGSILFKRFPIEAASIIRFQSFVLARRILVNGKTPLERWLPYDVRSSRSAAITREPFSFRMKPSDILHYRTPDAKPYPDEKIDFIALSGIELRKNVSFRGKKTHHTASPPANQTMLERMEVRWLNELDEAHNPTSFFGQEECMDEALKGLTKKERDELDKELVAKLKSGSALSKYESFLFDYLVERYIREQKLKRLADIWMVCYKPTNRTFPTEYSFAMYNKNAFDLLFEIYNKTDSSKVKANIVISLAKAFPDLRKRFKDDDAFVKATADWYSKNKATVRLISREKYGIATVNMSSDQWQELNKYKDRHVGLFFIPVGSGKQRPRINDISGSKKKEILDAYEGSKK